VKSGSLGQEVEEQRICGGEPAPCIDFFLLGKIIHIIKGMEPPSLGQRTRTSESPVHGVSR